MCKKMLRGMEKECLSCKADVSLLVDYVENLQEGVARAEALTKAGQLGDAVWAYLEVLEIDPDNATARRQVGKVATAVRQFDETAPGRRWLTKLHKQKRFARWMATWNEQGQAAGWLSAGLWFIMVLGVLLLGYILGMQHNPAPAKPADSAQQAPPAGSGKEVEKKAPKEGLSHEELAKPSGK
jgi:hypothetical protein